MPIGSRARSLILPLLALAPIAACGGDKASAGPAGSASAVASAAAPAVAAGPAGYRLEMDEDHHETPTRKLPTKLAVDGPAAAFLSDSPLPDGPRKWVTFHVFPKGTDPATICDSNFPGPKNKDEYILSVDAQYDGELKVGPAVSLGSPGLAYVSKSDDGNITGAAIGKPKFVDVHITSVTADAIGVVATSRPGAPFKLDATFIAKICKSE